MKKILLILMGAGAFGINAQQKLIGSSHTYYTQAGDAVQIDSSEYIYNSSSGSIYSNEPEFRLTGYTFNWHQSTPAIIWDEEIFYNGTPLPMNLTGSRNNTIVGGLVTVSELAGNNRVEYAYDLAGNVLSKEYYDFDGVGYVLDWGFSYEFDVNNNKVLEQYITYQGGTPSIQRIDSFFYDTSNKLIGIRDYELHFTNVLYLFREVFLSYSGSEISNIKTYQNNGSGLTSPLEWVNDIDYTHSNGKPESMKSYQINNGTPEPSPELEFYFSYGANNKISLKEIYVDGDFSSQLEYFYDGQGFISEVDRNYLNSMLALYTTESTRYYYQNTAGIDEVEVTQATVYPNPSNDFVSISADSEIEKVAVFNANGSIMISQNGGDVDISNLPAGVYFAKVKTATGAAQAQFVKQ